MAFEFLANISNNVSNAIQDIGNGEDAAYTLLDGTHAASGPRSEIQVWSPTDSTGAGIHYTYDTNEWEVDYLIIVRCDWVTSSSNVQYKVTQENSGGTVSDLVSWTTFSSPTLYGPRDQDFVLSLSTSSGERYGNGVAFKDSSNGSATYTSNDLIFGKSYDIGYPNKNPRPNFNYLPKDQQEFFPYEGYFPYSTEKSFTLTWPVLNRTEIQTFEAFLQYGKPLRVPFFLWDSGGDLFPHRLEHCLIETYQMQWLPTADHYGLQITFRRLKHYL